MRNFRNYSVYKDSFALAKEVYGLVAVFPESEKYGLRSQITRAVVSVPSNIAEGASRNSEIEFARFIEMAIGSAFELETQILLAVELNFIPSDQATAILTSLELVQKQLNGFRSTLLTKK